MTLREFLLDDFYTEEQKRRVRALETFCRVQNIDAEIDDIVSSDDTNQLTLRVTLEFE